MSGLMYCRLWLGLTPNSHLHPAPGTQHLYTTTITVPVESKGDRSYGSRLSLQLGLATPTAICRYWSGSERGLLIKGGDVLERVQAGYSSI